MKIKTHASIARVPLGTVAINVQTRLRSPRRPRWLKNFLISYLRLQVIVDVTPAEVRTQGFCRRRLCTADPSLN